MTAADIDWPALEANTALTYRIVRLVYTSAIAAGFTEAQAMRLTIAYQAVVASPQTQQPPPATDLQLAAMLAGKIPS